MANKIVILFIVLIVAAVGIFFVVNNNNSDGDNDDENTVQDSNEVENDDETTANEFSLDVEQTCEYVDEDQNVAKAYVKDGNYRIESMDDEGVLYSILFVSDTVYVWNDMESEGFQYSNDDLDAYAAQSPFSIDDFEAESEDESVSCTSGSVNDEVFEVPGDIDFVNYNDVIQEQLMNVPDIPTDL